MITQKNNHLLLLSIIILLIFTAFGCVENVDPNSGGTSESNTYTLTINIEGEGTVIISPEKNTYMKNEVVILNASPQTGYHFDHWNGDIAGEMEYRNVIITSNMAITAVFVKNTISIPTITPTPSGTATNSPTPTPPGTTTDSPTPIPTIPGTPNNSPTPISTIGISPTPTITPIIYHTLTVTKEGEGTITVTPLKDMYAHNEKVTVTAIPETGYSFLKWYTDLELFSNPLTITMENDISLKAFFEKLPEYTVTVNAYDKDLNTALSDVTVTVLEQNISNTLNTSDSLTLTTGRYTLLFEKTGYQTRGYHFIIDADKTINVYLKQNTTQDNTRGTISGTVSTGNIPYTNDFSLCTGNINKSDIYRITGNNEGRFSQLTSRTGDIVISAYVNENNMISHITYAKDIYLAPNQSFDTASLVFSSPATTVTGTFPENSTFIVRLNNEYIIARQEANPLISEFNFDINLADITDGITLESLAHPDTLQSLYARKKLTDYSITNSLTYSHTAPSVTLETTGDFYTLSLADTTPYCEVYIFQYDGVQPSIPIVMSCLNTNRIILPTRMIDNNAQYAVVYVTDIYMTNFNANDCLTNNLNLNEFEYGETGIQLPLANQSSMITRRNNTIPNHRQLLNITGLISE